MRIELKMVVVLTLITLISGMVLGLVYTQTNPKIHENLELAKERALKKVIPNVSSYDVKEVDRYTTIFTARDSSGDIVGYGVLIQGSGFQGPIKLMVGFDTTKTRLTGIEVIENVETPGLGNRITEDWFRQQFAGRVPPIEVVKGKKPSSEHEIQAITGATISSRSVVRIVNMAQSKLMSAFPATASVPKRHGAVSQIAHSSTPPAAKKEVPHVAKHKKIPRSQTTVTESKSEPVDSTCLKYMSYFLKKIERCRTVKLPDSSIVYIVRRDSGDALVGVVVQGSGFMDKISLLVAMDANDFRIYGIKILEMAEGEAFGKGRDSTFWAQFRDKIPPLAIRSDDNPQGIDAISGATETSNAVLSLVNVARIKAEKALSIAGFSGGKA